MKSLLFKENENNIEIRKSKQAAFIQVITILVIIGGMFAFLLTTEEGNLLVTSVVTALSLVLIHFSTAAIKVIFQGEKFVIDKQTKMVSKNRKKVTGFKAINKVKLTLSHNKGTPYYSLALQQKGGGDILLGVESDIDECRKIGNAIANLIGVPYKEKLK